MPVDYIGFAYAATVAAGGIIGYAKAGMMYSFVYHNNIPNTWIQLNFDNYKSGCKRLFGILHYDIYWIFLISALYLNNICLK